MHENLVYKVLKQAHPRIISSHMVICEFLVYYLENTNIRSLIFI